MTDQIIFAEAGIKQAPWPTYSVVDSFRHYVREHAKPNGVNVKDVARAMWHAFQVWEPTYAA